MRGYLYECLKMYFISLPFLILTEVLLYYFYKKKGLIIKKAFLIGWQAFACLLTAFFTVTGIPGIHELRNYDQLTMNTFNLKLNITISAEQFYNILLFIPIGLLLPLLWKSGTYLITTVSGGFLLSLLIEFSQLFTFRATDINDLVLNTLGTLIGYVLYYLLLRKWQGIQLDNSQGRFFVRNSALLNIMLLFVLHFLIIKPVIYYCFFSTTIMDLPHPDRKY